MGYIIVGAIILITFMPLSIRNLTKYRQEQISKRALSLGVQLDFEESRKW